jgi:hypothetical protein
MHTGSGIFAKGEALVTSWQPDSPHDEVLLLARVPRLHRTVPNQAGGATGAPWGSEPLSRRPPSWIVVNITEGETAVKQTVRSGEDFHCDFEYSTRLEAAFPVATGESPSPAAAVEHHALVALNGSWFGGGLPSRACVMYRIPRSNLPAKGGLAAWRPWFNGSKPLYRDFAGTAGEDLRGEISFETLSIRGSFAPGDVVRPMLATVMGAANGSALSITDQGRGAGVVGLRQPVAQAMLFVNTHPPEQIFT